ncbi:MAG TPA: transglutaminase family protein [Rhodanobacter sp.]
MRELFPKAKTRASLIAALVFSAALGIYLYPCPGHAASSVGIKLPNDPNVRVLRALLGQPENQIDFAKAKVTIDRMIDPTVDEQATLNLLDAWAHKVRARIPPGASHVVQLMILGSTIYEPGPWNDNKPFSYDLDDPFGKDIQNKLISTYLATRKGNCVSMPILLVILGQKIGLNMTLAVAPNHMLAKFRQDDGTWINIEATSGTWINIEATSGTTFNDSDYQSQLHITPLGMQSGIYLRPLSQKEAVGAMMGTLEDFYERQRSPEHQLGLTELALKVNPKDVVSIIRRAGAYYHLLQQRYVSRYPRPDLIPASQRGDFQMLSKNNSQLFEQAEALGWRQPTNEEDAAYLQRARSVKAQRGE